MSSRTLSGLLALVFLLLAPVAARAGTATVDRFTAGRGDEAFKFVAYRAAPGERNDVSVAGEIDAPTGAAYGVLHDAVGVTPGSGCTAVDPRTVRCLIGSPTSEQDAPFSPAPQQFDLSLGDRADRAVVVPGPSVAARMDGGSGDDVLVGGTGGGQIDEETPFLDGNVLIGDPGRDTLTGGSHDDLFAQGAAPDGSDTIRGGPGRDEVTYEKRRSGVRVDLRGDRNAGGRGEHDHLAADLEIATGGSGPDRLRGNEGANTLQGGRGRDVLLGAGGRDFLIAGPGDRIGGSYYLQTGDRSPNVLDGGSGADELVGNAGPDRIDAGPGEDVVFAAGGADVVLARDHSHDEIDCGGARDDRLVADGLDWADRGCERVRRRGAPRVTLLGDGDLLTAPGTSAGIPLGCPADIRGRCRVSARLTTDGRVLGRARLVLRHGRSEPSVPLNATGRRTVGSRATTRAELILVTSRPGGGPATYRHAVKLER